MLLRDLENIESSEIFNSGIRIHFIYHNKLNRKQIKIKHWRKIKLKVFIEYIMDRSSKAVVLGFTVLSSVVHFVEDQLQRA